MTKRISILVILAAFSMTVAISANSPGTITDTANQSLTTQQSVRHDMTNYVLTDSSSYITPQTLVVNGKKLDVHPLQINHCLLVPARAVSDALGFTTTWHADEQSVTIIGSSMKTTQYLGVDFSNAVTTISGADGMTSPPSFGAPPVLVNNTAYVPVEIFKIIQGNDPSTLTITDTMIELKKR